MDQFLSYLQNGEYPRIYQLLSSTARSSVSLVSLSKQYDDIYKLIGLQKTVCKLTSIKPVDANNMLAHFTMTVTAEKLGQFTMNMDAPLHWDSGKWLIDWTTELILQSLEKDDKVQLKVNPAKRGEIFDVNGDVLAKNSYALSVFVDTAKVKNYETLIRLLAPELGMTESDVRTKLKSAMKNAPGAAPRDDDAVPPEAAGLSETGSIDDTTASVEPSPSLSPTPSPSASATATQAPAVPKSICYVVKAFPPNSISEDEQKKLMEIPGVGVDSTSMTTIRTYPFGDMLAQTLGYTGVMSKEELTKPENAGLPQDASIGKIGLEKAFELDLRGQPGYDLVIVDNTGTSKITLAHRAGSDGHDLRLTIDAKLQQRAEMLLRQYLTPEMAGAIVVLDPKTGYVQVMASAPSFDPNLFSFPVDPEVMKFLNDPVNMNPFINRATEGRYPPGSTFKPFTAAMGLTDKKITTNTVFPYEITNNKWTPNESFGFTTPITRKDPTPNPVNLQNAIIHSDNIFFAYIALKVGEDKFYQHCTDLGLGADAEHRMKFDLPLKSSQISNTDKIQTPRQLADSGYGQGQLLITPVQMAALFGSLGNNGDIMLPRLVKSVCHTDGPHYIADKTNPPEVWKQGVVSSSILHILLPSLKKVAQEGTAKALNQYKDLKDYEICAKTGTAEIGSTKAREIAWLIGFTTKKDLNRLVCVTIEVPAGDGSIRRTDIAKQMFENPEVLKDTEDKQDNKENGQ